MFEVKPARIPAARTSGSSGCGFFVIGFMLSGIGFGLAWPGLHATRWPTVPGTVIESSIQTSHSSKGGTTHTCRVSYWFIVDGTRYSGDRLDALKMSTSGDGPFEDQKRYPPGAPCEVHFNPDNPNESCLRPAPPTFAWVMITIGFFFCSIAAIAWATSWWKKGVGGGG